MITKYQSPLSHHYGEQYYSLSVLTCEDIGCAECAAAVGAGTQHELVVAGFCCPVQVEAGGGEGNVTVAIHLLDANYVVVVDQLNAEPRVVIEGGDCARASPIQEKEVYQV